MDNNGHQYTFKKNVFSTVKKLFHFREPGLISRNNRLTKSYIYGFENVVSLRNRIVDSYVDEEQSLDNVKIGGGEINNNDGSILPS